MKIKFLKIAFLTSLVLFLFTTSVQATSPLDVAINEMAWMGTQASYHDEWIELYNNTDSSINLAGWLLKATDETPEINLAGTVPANGFYLLERTDDTTIPDVAADQVYAGALGNNGEYLKLFDDQNNLIDEINCSESWFAGDNTTKQTMERISPASSGSAPENWQTSQNPGGTPKSQNSAGQSSEPVCEPSEEICDGIDNDCDGEVDEDNVCVVPEPTPEPEPTAEPEPEPEPTVYPSGIFINEFLPSPEGPDVEGEWIEFYNSNTMLIDLSGWSIEDAQGSTKSYTFSDGITITGYDFLVLDRPTSKVVLNNDGEGLILKNPLGELVNSVNYDGKAPEGQSYARKTNGTWEWSLAPSPGKENSFPLSEESEPEAKPKAQPEPKTETIEEPSSVPRSETSKGKSQSESITYPSGIMINEILPSPTGSDSEGEWIEIFNQNSFEVDLSGWQLQDMEGKIRAYTLPQGTKINPQGFLVLSRPTTKITLNNDVDGLNLIQPNNNIINQVSYGKAPTGSSYSRTDSGWAWSNTLTPGSKNIVPAQASEERADSYSKTPGEGLAAIGKQIPKISRSLSVSFIALAIAIFSGVIVFVLKKRIKSI